MHFEHPLRRRTPYKSHIDHTALSFRSVDGLNFSGAYAQLASVIAELYKKHIYLAESERIQPLDKEQFHRTAAEKGYYRDMQDAIKWIMQVIKDNNSLEFAVITGCLQIAKESIFTGTNNFVSDTISEISTFTVPGM